MADLLSPQQLAQQAKASAAIARQLVAQNPQVPGAAQTVVPTAQGATPIGGGRP